MGLESPTSGVVRVDDVQITMSEEIGVAGRGSFYEEAGVLLREARRDYRHDRRDNRGYGYYGNRRHWDGYRWRYRY